MILTRSSPRDCEMIFFIGRGFAKLQILKKWWWHYLLNWVEYCDEILHTHWYWQNVFHEVVKWHLRLAEFLPRFKFWKKCDYRKMAFIIGRGFAERKIFKKWKWPYLLNWVEYFNRLQRKNWYWQDLAQEIAKCHFPSVQVLLSSKFWKSVNGPSSWTERNIVMKFCIHIGILTRCSPWDCQMTFGICRGFCRGLNSEKKWNLTLKPFGIFW